MDSNLDEIYHGRRKWGRDQTCSTTTYIRIPNAWILSGHQTVHAHAVVDVLASCWYSSSSGGRYNMYGADGTELKAPKHRVYHIDTLALLSVDIPQPPLAPDGFAYLSRARITNHDSRLTIHNATSNLVSIINKENGSCWMPRWWKTQ
ncbi:hypothetical protein BELL_0006g00230 [Botrytis elliptica]|uniref:Uncharacterized protein n=1 Tax=Botrytis elliptica TaxID=278938 RepID=A0A4Z1KH73_9HELO|nr:hypothetical protein BELL_0006g00230 [Botrytis elliptica]